MRVLVTGGTGFVGRVTAMNLAEHGHDVWLLVRPGREGLAPAGTRLLVGDLEQRRYLRHSLFGVGFDGVCHLAARTLVRESFTDPLGYYDANLGGTLNLIAELRAVTPPDSRPMPFVFASTNAVYGPQPHDVLGEDLVPNPTSPYGRSKLMAEQLLADCATAGMVSATVLRLFNVAGAQWGVADPNPTRIINAALETAAGLRPAVRINGDGSAVREFTHVWDVAEAFRLALEHAATEPGSRLFNVGTGEGVAMSRVVEVAEKVTERPIALEHGPAAQEPQVLVADTTRVREVLGWSPSRSALEAILADAWAAR